MSWLERSADTLPKMRSRQGSTLWGFFIHANLKLRFGPLEWLVATPAFHHWHHTYDGPLDKNFSALAAQYIINGGSFKITGSGNVTGTNLTFFITGQNGHVAGVIALSGSGNLNITAPSSGVYQGLLFYQDQNVTYTAANAISMSGNGNTSGSFYFPTTQINDAGSGNQTP